MSTPKEKVISNQALVAKKKKFFRILQSSKCDKSYYCKASEQLKNEIEKRMQTILNEIKPKQEDRPNVKLDDKISDGDDNKEFDKTKIAKMAKKRRKNASPELVFGLNQTLKMIKNVQVCLIMADCDLGTNLLNVVHKLCSINKIYCVDINLKGLQKLFNLSSLSILSFKLFVTEKVSNFNKIYEFVLENCFQNEKQDTKLQNVESSLKALPSKIIDHSSSCSMNKDFSYYVANNSDPYSAIMETKLNKINDMNQNEFTTQASFIVLSKSDQSLYFTNYNQSPCKYNFEIIMDQSAASDQKSAERANKFAEKLFDLDSIEPGPSANSKLKFRSPSLFKGQVDIHKSNLQKKKIARKMNNNNKKKTL